MQVKRVSGDAVELRQTSLGKAPEALDAIDVVLPESKFVGLMVHPQVLLIPHVHQTVVARPAVGMDDRFETDSPQNGFAQGLSATVGHDLGVNMAIAFEDAKDDGLARSAPASLAANASGAEVTLIDFDLAGKWALGFTPPGDLPPKLEINRVGGPDGKTRDGGRFGGGQIQGKGPNQTPKNLLGNAGTDVVLIFACIHSGFAILQAA